MADFIKEFAFYSDQGGFPVTVSNILHSHLHIWKEPQNPCGRRKPSNLGAIDERRHILCRQSGTQEASTRTGDPRFHFLITFDAAGLEVYYCTPALHDPIVI
jgi:hypothetical protein